MDSTEKIVGCFAHAFEDLGLDAPGADAARSTIGLSLFQAMRVLVPDADEVLAGRLVERYRHWFSTSTRRPLLFPHAHEVLQVLEARGLWIAVATGKSSAGLERDLSATGLSKLCHATRCADQAHSKPHPQMLWEIMADVGVDASSTVMIGDTSFDLEMAGNAGTRGIAVTYGAHGLERLLEFSPYAILDTLVGLPDLLVTFD